MYLDIQYDLKECEASEEAEEVARDVQPRNWGYGLTSNSACSRMQETRTGPSAARDHRPDSALRVIARGLAVLYGVFGMEL
jgi:hypothetical protein